MKCPCHECKRRTIEPNCHDAARCEAWAAYEAQQRRARLARQEECLVSKHNNVTVVKTNTFKGWTYVQGDTGGIAYGRRKKQYLPARQRDADA